MFKVPDWEEDVPKNSVVLGKKLNQKKQQKLAVKLPPSPRKLIKKTNSKEKQTSNDDKSTAKKRNHNGAIIKNGSKKENYKIDVSNIDTDKIDEVLLNAKRKKFYEPLKKDDIEHVLFREDTNKARKTVPNNKISSSGKTIAKIIDKKHKSKSKKKIVKKRNNSEPEINIPIKKVFQVKTNVNTEINENKPIEGQTVNKKKEKFKAILQLNSNRNTISVKGNKLRERMLNRLKAAQFRYINEKLYTSSGSEAKEMFQSDPDAFHTYHQGYQQQVKKWPVNPLDVIVKRIQKMPKTHMIADMGCGEGALSKRIPHKVRSFDVVSTAPGVEICDMAHTPLLSASVDVAVYCLALMGTELTQYLVEANRVLKMGGHLLVAEVESRFTNVEEFTKEVCRLGFKLKKLDKQHQVFFFMEFEKIRDPPAKKNKLPTLTLKPCLYKKR